MSLRGMVQNENGQVVPIEYLQIFSILVVFFGLSTIAISSFVDDSSRQAVYVEFTDIGNQVSSAITSSYLSTPLNGETISVVIIPAKVAGREYFIDVTDENPYEQGKKAVRITSVHNSMTVYVPLNTIDKVVEVSGSVYSASEKIVITGTIDGINISSG